MHHFPQGMHQKAEMHSVNAKKIRASAKYCIEGSEIGISPTPTKASDCYICKYFLKLLAKWSLKINVKLVTF